jgi:hypothetical protein
MKPTVYHPWRDATSLIATAAYTRGLWSVLFLWRALTPRAFKGRPTEWGIDEAFMRAELKRALILFLPLTALQGLLFFVYIKWSSLVAAFLFILSLLLEWTVIPWLAARRLMREQRSTSLRAETRTVVAPSSESPISDLGFLLREASFAVDTSAAQAQQPETPQQIGNALIDRLESKFGATWDQGVTAQRVRIVPVDVAQPPRWSFTKSGSYLDVSADDGTERLIIFGQRPGEDGLAAVEFAANAIKDYLSITIRARWLPPLRGRFGRLACLPLQKTWWRAVAVPIGLTVGLLLVFAVFVVPQWMAGGGLARAGEALVQGMFRPAMATQEPPETETSSTSTQGLETDTAATDTAFDLSWLTQTDTATSAAPADTPDDPYASLPTEPEAVDPAIAEAQAAYERELQARMAASNAAIEPAPQPSWLDFVVSGFVFVQQFISLSTLVNLAAFVAFMPVAGFVVLLLTRLLRYLRGLLYAATGTVMNVSTPNCYRFRASQLELGDDGAVRSGLKYLQIIEESVLETIIAALHERNIDTKSIRAEAQILINEGIYMTGGSLAASNVVVGAFAKIGARHRRKLAHAGKVSYGEMQQKYRRAG